MQATPKAQSPVIATPEAPETPTVVRVQQEGGVVRVYTMPQTREEVAAMRQRRAELSEQLTSAASRRRSLANQLDGMPPGAARDGIEARVRQLDERILRLEADIDATGALITSAPAIALAPPPAPQVFGGRMSEENFVILSGVFTVFVLSPLAIAAARLMFRRAKVPVQPPGAVESAARLERIEQAIDAIAIEVERISEGQRYNTRLLAEAQGMRGLGVPQPQAEAVGVREADALRMRDVG